MTDFPADILRKAQAAIDRMPDVAGLLNIGEFWEAVEKEVCAAILEERNRTEWQPIETAPKGEPKPYGRGPQILGCSVGNGWSAMQIVRWDYHKNPDRGAWKGPNGVWTPTHWMPLPSPPKTESASLVEEDA